MRRDGDDQKFVVDQLKAHSAAGPFLEPVDVAAVPDYLDVVPDPVDLQTVDDRRHRGKYVDLDALLADVARIFANCRAYNRADSPLVELATTLEAFAAEVVARRRAADVAADVDDDDDDDEAPSTPAPARKRPRRGRE